MIRIEAREGEALERLLKRFKKLCEKEGLTKDVKKTAYYEKPSERKRRRIRASMKKALKETARDIKLANKQTRRYKQYL